MLLLLVCLIPPSLVVVYDILEYHQTALRISYFYSKNGNVLSCTPTELVQVLQLINQFILLCASLFWINQEFFVV